jgi:hypothetical protein
MLDFIALYTGRQGQKGAIVSYCFEYSWIYTNIKARLVTDSTVEDSSEHTHPGPSQHLGASTRKQPEGILKTESPHTKTFEPAH